MKWYVGIGCFLTVAALVVVFSLLNVDQKHYSNTQTCDVDSDLELVEGGSFVMGAGAQYPEETPARLTKVDSFYMSTHEVTNRQFNDFVEATGYLTVAERALEQKDFLGIPKEQLVPGSAVFVKLSEAVEATTFLNWWHFIEGASWRQPLGPGSSISDKLDFPVVHIAYEDAQAYAKWAGARLPTEAEFEYASRNKLEDAKYATGDSLKLNDQYMANTWQGLFPFNDSAEDGFEGLAPVGCYPRNAYGIHDLIGNVWEWTQSKYYPRHYQHEEIPEDIRDTGYDPNQPGVSVGVIKGGSFLCAEDFCMRYRPAARHAQDTGLGTSHIGFRIVKDL